MIRVKQGQTIYIVDNGLWHNPPKPEIIKFMLYSIKQPLPPEGERIIKMPVNYANKIMLEGHTKIHTSRRKAIRELNNP